MYRSLENASHTGFFQPKARQPENITQTDEERKPKTESANNYCS